MSALLGCLVMVTVFIRDSQQQRRTLKVPGSHVPPQCCLQTRVTEPSSVSDPQDWTTAQWAAVMSGPASNVSAGEEGTPMPVPVQACRSEEFRGKGCSAGHGGQLCPGWGTCPSGVLAWTPPVFSLLPLPCSAFSSCEAPSTQSPLLCLIRPCPLLPGVTDRGGSWRTLRVGLGTGDWHC